MHEIFDLRVKYYAKDNMLYYQRIVLCHYAMTVWKNSGRGSWQLYGHSHGTLPNDPHAFQMDVGVDSLNTFKTPISFYQVKKLMEKKSYIPRDYHGVTGASSIPEHMAAKEAQRKAIADKMVLCGSSYKSDDEFLQDIERYTNYWSEKGYK